MDAGMHGVLGAAAARPVEEASSRDRESVRDLSLVGSLALEKRESRSVAMRRDAPVSVSKTSEIGGCTNTTVRKEITDSLFLCLFL